MGRVNNLYESHKERIARLSDDRKKLFVGYELSKPTGLKPQEIEYSFNSTVIGKCHVVYKNQKLFIEIDIGRQNLNKLYKIFLIISYLLGNEIKLYYLYESFPYYDIPHDFNFGGYAFCFTNQIRLILDAKNAIEAGYLLLNKDDEFGKVLHAMLLLNTIFEVNTRFFVEYSILEFLSRHQNVSGKIFETKGDKEELKSFSKKIRAFLEQEKNNIPKHIKENEIFAPKIQEIKNKLSSINEKSVWKDRIKSYIESFESRRIKSFSKYLQKWSDLRNKKGLAHGTLFIRK